MASVESVNHGAVIDLLGFKPIGRPTKEENLASVASRASQHDDDGLILLALVIFFFFSGYLKDIYTSCVCVCVCV